MNKINCVRAVNFKQQNINPKTNNIAEKNKEYNDPLMKWPIRGAAFTNEVGEALRPLIGHTAATCSWIPALLYFGADIYDKYKNNGTDYEPNKSRGVEQAIFQGLASITLPLGAVKLGQYLFSQFGKITKDKVTFNKQQAISELAERFIDDGKMRAFDCRDAECINEFLDKVKNNYDVKKHTKIKISNFDNKEQIEKYAESTIKDLIQLRKDLLESSDKNMKTTWYTNYQKALKSGKTESVAVKSTLKEFQNKKILKGNAIKTVGGFVALGCLIKPIDHFVEEIVLKKWVNPIIDKTQSKNNT